MKDDHLRHAEETAAETPGKIFELLDKIAKSPQTVVRDDQADFNTFLDAFRSAASSGKRFGLLDTGRFDNLQMGWLVKAGIDLYTSDEARSDMDDLRVILKACDRGGSRVAFFQHGELVAESEQKKIALSDLKALARSGVYLYISNRIHKRNGDDLVSLAGDCRRGGSWFVYYHHGALDPVLVDLAAARAWIHVSGQSVASDADVALLMKAAGAGKKRRIILTLDEWISLDWFQGLFRAGIFLLMRTPPADFQSPLRSLEKKIRARRLDKKAFYITTAFMP